jgi:CheY-like chemotaxis protein
LYFRLKFRHSTFKYDDDVFPLSAGQNIVETAPSAVFNSLVKCGGTILLVDDEEVLRSVGSELLDAMGFSVMTAANGREALEIYNRQESRIDLILMDMLMPVMGGLETYRKLREISPLIPVVICSGCNTEDIMVELSNDRHASVIQKPYKPDMLQDMLMMHLDERREKTAGTTAL